MPRERFAPWPWRARLRQPNAGRWQLNLPRIDAAFVAVLHRLLEREPGVWLTDSSGSSGAGLTLAVGGCALEARGFGEGSPFAEDHTLSLWPKSESADPACEPALRRLAKIIDAEVSTGKHDALLKLD